MAALMALLTWPLVLLVPLVDEYERHFNHLQNDLFYWVTAVSVSVAVLGAWWNILAVVFMKPRKAVRVLFGPFADAFKPKWAIVLLAIGSVMMILSAGVGFVHYEYFN